jgi:hypothetical protein
MHIQQNEVGKIALQKPNHVVCFVAYLALHTAGDLELGGDQSGEVFVILGDDNKWFWSLVHLVSSIFKFAVFVRRRVCRLADLRKKDVSFA